MAESPLDNTEGVITVSVKADGQEIDKAELLRVDVEFAANRLARARLADEEER